MRLLERVLLSLSFSLSLSLSLSLILSLSEASRVRHVRCGCRGGLQTGRRLWVAVHYEAEQKCSGVSLPAAFSLSLSLSLSLFLCLFPEGIDDHLSRIRMSCCRAECAGF